MPAEDVTVTANFVAVEPPTYELTLEDDPDGAAEELTGAGVYEEGEVVSVSATAEDGFEFVNWTSPAGTFEDEWDPNTTFTMPGEDVTVTAILAQPGDPVDLGTACNYVILSKAGITNVPTSSITGDIGVSPIDSEAITGFALEEHESGKYATSTQVDGRVYAADYDEPTPSELTTAVSDMEAAYTYAAGRAANFLELDDGKLSDITLEPGVYKWSTGVDIDGDVNLDGGANDVWIFQISGKLTQASDTSINLEGEAQAENVFWQVADTVSIGADADFEGIVLGKTDITLQANASVNGKLFAQTEVTLIKNTITEPE